MQIVHFDTAELSHTYCNAAKKSNLQPREAIGRET